MGSTVLEQACSAGADIRAVVYRLWMLGFLEMLPGDLLGRWKDAGQLDDAVFWIIARLPLKWMAVGLVQSEFPFDVQSFLKELGQESPRP